MRFAKSGGTGGPRALTLVAGHGEIGGGEQMLLRIAEAAQALAWPVRVVGPRWGELGQTCSDKGLEYREISGSSRRTYAAAVTLALLEPGPGVVWAVGALPALCATTTPNPLIVHIHQLLQPAQRAALAPALRRAREVIVPSAFLQQSLPGSTVMSNWTNELPVVARPEPSGQYTVGYVGRLSHAKGVDTLIDAVSLLSERRNGESVRLLLAGDSRFVSDASASEIRRRLLTCEAEVENLGWVDPKDVVAQSTVVVVPSRAPESFGLVAAEAMAMGCPLVISDAGALPEVVGADYPWVFRAGDSEELAQSLQRIRNTPTADLVGEMRQRWVSQFSPPAGRSRLRGVLAGLCD